MKVTIHDVEYELDDIAMLASQCTRITISAATRLNYNPSVPKHRHLDAPLVMAAGSAFNIVAMPEGEWDGKPGDKIRLLTKHLLKKVRPPVVVPDEPPPQPQVVDGYDMRGLGYQPRRPEYNRGGNSTAPRPQGGGYFNNNGRTGGRGGYGMR